MLFRSRFETNFYVIFEPGTLEEAPQTAVILARIEGERERAELQRDLVVRFANVSVLDLSRLQQTIDEILQRANQGIRFLGVFSTVAGVLVLIGALSTSRYQRMRESALLKTLGATRRVVLKVLTVEYAVLGSLATAAGLVPLTLDGGDYWHLSEAGWREIAESSWPDCEVDIRSHGNCLSATAAIMGLAYEELDDDELDAQDPRYPVLVTLLCKKP